jgi:hypothetical protein
LSEHAICFVRQRYIPSLSDEDHQLLRRHDQRPITSFLLAGLCDILDLQRRQTMTWAPHVAHRSFTLFVSNINDRGMCISNLSRIHWFQSADRNRRIWRWDRLTTNYIAQRSDDVHQDADFGSAISARELLSRFDWLDTIRIGQHLSASKMSSPCNIYINYYEIYDHNAWYGQKILS